jgi:hypothetical protein
MNEKMELTDSLRNSFLNFWGEHLKIVPSSNGFLVSLPLMYSDGWHVEISLTQITPKQWLLSDKGKTLGLLLESGVGVEKKKMKEIIRSKCSFYQFSQQGLNLEKVIENPFSVADIQIFAEGLVALSHHVPVGDVKKTINSEQIVNQAISTYFYDRHLTPQEHYKLSGRIEKEIVVDYYFEVKQPLALQSINRSKDLLPYMEQWGYRWLDLQSSHPEIKRAMIYDPDNQKWDHQSLEIGKAVCDYFLPYEDAELLDEVLVA